MTNEYFENPENQEHSGSNEIRRADNGIESKGHQETDRNTARQINDEHNLIEDEHTAAGSKPAPY